MRQCIDVAGMLLVMCEECDLYCDILDIPDRLRKVLLAKKTNNKTSIYHFANFTKSVSGLLLV